MSFKLTVPVTELGRRIYENAVLHGFYDGITNYKDPIWCSNRLMLITSELAEALEGIRDGNFSSTPKSGGVGEELADACIRIFDFAYSLSIDLQTAIEEKMDFNATREYKHGKKAL